LNSLTFLDLNANRIITLPHSIEYFESLEQLDLSCNQLTSLPEGIFELNSLKEIILWGNSLDSTRVGYLGKLKENGIYISHESKHD
jgi:Leucine-rich repeat (LRR) protein